MAAEKPKCDVDPVCQIDLTAMHGRYTYDFEDQTYYFCSEACKEQFAAEPKKFAKPDLAHCDIDPVCQLDLKAMHGKFMYDFEDETYYFCSELCQKKFAAEPEKFVKKK